MPDVVTEAAGLSLSQMEDLMEDEHPANDPMLSLNMLNSPHSPSSSSSNLNGVTSAVSMLHDPLLSSLNGSGHHHHHHQHRSSSSASNVHTNHHHSNHSHHHNSHHNGGSTLTGVSGRQSAALQLRHTVDISSCMDDPLMSSPTRSLLSTDSDSLVSDIDMVA